MARHFETKERLVWSARGKEARNATVILKKKETHKWIARNVEIERQKSI